MGGRRHIDPEQLDHAELEAIAAYLDKISLDTRQVAERIGLADLDALSTYIGGATPRFPDFPEPWTQRGRFIKLWLPWQIDAWLEAHPRVGRKRPDPG